MPKVAYGDTPGQFLGGSNYELKPLVFKLGEWVVAKRPELKAALGGVQFWENKSKFLHECATSPAVCTVLSIPQTYHSSDAGEPQFTGPCWFKPVVGASGNGTEPCESKEDFVSLLDRFRVAGEDFQIQEHVPGENLSAQLWVDDAGAQVLSTTDQIMGGDHLCEHIGNNYPSTGAQQLLPVAQALGDFVQASGYQGPCGFDFRRHKGTGRVYLLEMNARLTGAHYPGALAGLLGFTQWRHIMVEGVRPGPLQTDPATFMGHLRKNDLLWTNKTQTGVVPWYIGTLPAGKVMLLIPGDCKQQDSTLRVFQHACC